MQGSRRRTSRAEAGLESLLHYQPTHASVEDNMKEAVHMLDLLAPDQRKGFLRLFGQFVQQRHKPAVEWARLEQPPKEAVVHATNIPPCPKDQALRHELLDKMVILKLNGENALSRDSLVWWLYDLVRSIVQQVFPFDVDDVCDIFGNCLSQCDNSK